MLQLTTSYRSVPAIQRFVNAAFAGEMTGDARTLQADYVPLAPHRADDDSQPAVVALPVPQAVLGARTAEGVGEGDRGVAARRRRRVHRMADRRTATAGRSWSARRDGAERRVPLAARHIAVLFRRFVSFGEDVTRKYVDAIEARGIPHLLVGGKAFHDREEVETIRAALAAIEWPDDELSVFATLQGVAVRHRRCSCCSSSAIGSASLHPFRVPRELGGNSGQELALTGEPTTQLTPIADALRLLQQLHRRRNYRPVADTIGRLLAETRAHVGFILRPAGEQALANVLHVAELARQYEAAGGISFRGFIDELRTASELEAAEAPILEESSDGVRLMTVHKAKGLEFPVVILADLTCRLSRDDASRYLDAERGSVRDEARRLGAARAARSRGRGGGARPGGRRPPGVRRGDARARSARRAGARRRTVGGRLAVAAQSTRCIRRSTRGAAPARGAKCPAFRVERHRAAAARTRRRRRRRPSRPARIVFADGGYSVVWWDPGPGGG